MPPLYEHIPAAPSRLQVHPFGASPEGSHATPSLHQLIHAAPSLIRTKHTHLIQLQDRPMPRLLSTSTPMPLPAVCRRTNLGALQEWFMARLPSNSTPTPLPAVNRRTQFGASLEGALTTSPLYQHAYVNPRLDQRLPFCRWSTQFMAAPGGNTPTQAATNNRPYATTRLGWWHFRRTMPRPRSTSIPRNHTSILFYFHATTLHIPPIFLENNMIIFYP